MNHFFFFEDNNLNCRDCVFGQYLVNKCNHQYSLCGCDVSDKDELTILAKYHRLKGLDGMWIPTSPHTGRIGPGPFSFFSLATPWQWILPLAWYSNLYQYSSAFSKLFDQNLITFSKPWVKNQLVIWGLFTTFWCLCSAVRSFSLPKSACNSGQCISADGNIKNRVCGPTWLMIVFTSSWTSKHLIHWYNQDSVIM